MPAGEPHARHQELLHRAYAAYNGQDAEHLLELVSDDVLWPDDHGGMLHGREALRAYWTEQWTRTRTHDRPVTFTELDDGRIAVDVEQEVRSLDGTLLSAGRVVHLHRIEGDWITRMEIVRPPGG